MVKKGILIVFEGTDGTGKSTPGASAQPVLAGPRLSGHCKPVKPTEGQYGKEIRSLYMHRNTCSRDEELELFLADRREHVQQVLAPGLTQGKIILCDRYFLSTAAYQGARGFDPEEILRKNQFAPDPDLALLFQAPLDTGLTRITSGRGEQLNDF